MAGADVLPAGGGSSGAGTSKKNKRGQLVYDSTEVRYASDTHTHCVAM